MKKNLNIIQIRGIKGLVIAGMIISCLIAGFIGFPGLVAMHIWNITANYIENMPSIGLLQGILLWGIILASYFTFRKERLVVCMKSPQGLNDEELKSVFADLKKQAQDDKIIQAMMKARDAELKVKEEESNSKSDIK